MLIFYFVQCQASPGKVELEADANGQSRMQNSALWRFVVEGIVQNKTEN